jgi:dihydrolipoamide dehydrogenase
MENYDIVIIGGGPGGYVAAIRGAQLGLRVAKVEMEEIGGLCLNWGCIPSKALLRNAEILSLMHRSDEFGISFDNLSVDYGKAVDRSRQVVKRLVGGLKSLMKRYGIDLITGYGSVPGPGLVSIDGREELEAANIIVATGARNKGLPPVPVDGDRIITTREALSLREVPGRTAIVGGGAAGVEFAYLWATYGSEVTIIELLPHLLPNEDVEISQTLEKSFQKQGIKLMTGSRVEASHFTNGVGTITLSTGDVSTEIHCDKILVAVGLEGNVDGTGLKELGIEMQNGFIVVDESMRTSLPNVFAVGDVTGAPLLAHTAFAQGHVAVETIAGLPTTRIIAENIPRATYCQPQVASVGITEAQARERGLEVKVGKFPFMASGKALGHGDREGFVKVVAGAEYGEILGAHMIGPEVTELLGEVTVAQALDATVEDIGLAVHPHPTLSEALKEAALGAMGQAVHM